MSQGVLIYCFDDGVTAYHRITNFCISLVKKNLKLPVTVVTNVETADKIRGHDQTLIIENNKGNTRIYKNKIIPWYNLERIRAYELSPYNETILIDSDYFVYTDNLLELMKSRYDFLLHDQAHDLTNRNHFKNKDMSMIPIVWATVIMFKKNEYCKKIFEMTQHIQHNFDYFYNLYRINFRNYRNDYAFAIALKQISNSDKQHFIPSAMSMWPMDTQVIKIDNTGLTFRFNQSINAISNQDVHVLNKEIVFND
jgi:hypothetical protein